MDRRADWNQWKKQNGVSTNTNTPVSTQNSRSGGSNSAGSGKAVSRRDDWEAWKKENNAEAKAFVQDNLPGIKLAGTDYINKLSDAMTDVAGGVTGLGKSSFTRDFDEYDKQAKRFERDSKLYPEMASQAVKTGNPTLYAQALEGLTNRAQKYEDAAARMPDATKAYMENLKQTDPAIYYGQTMEQSEIEKKLYAARGQLDRAKSNRNGPAEARPEDAPRGYQVIDLAEQQMEGASGASVERLRENWQAQEQEELGRKRDAEIEELSGQVKMWESARRIRADYDDYQEKSKAAREIEQEARKSEDFAELSDPYSKKLYRLMSYIDDNEHRMLYNAMTEEEKAVYHWLWAKYADDASMYTLIQEYEKKPDIQERYKAASADNRYKLNSEDDIFRNAARVWNYIKDSVYSGANRGIQGILAWINPAWEPYMEGYRPHEEELANAMSRMSPGYRALGGAAQSVGQMLPSIAAGKLAGALVSAFPTAVTALGGLTKGAVTAERIIRWTQNAAFFMSSAGAARQEAKERYGMNAEQAEVFSVLSGLSEVYLQNVIGGIAAFGGIGEQELAARIDLIENALARTVLHGGLNVLGEELEENTQNFLEPLFVTMLTGADYQTPTAEETLETFLSTLFMVSSMNAGDSVSVYKSAKYENNLKALAKGCRELGGEYELVANQIDSLLGAARENPEMWITKEDFLAATDLKAMAEERMQKSGTSAQEVGEALAAAVKERTDGQEQRQAGSEDNGAPERETSAAPEQSETEAGQLRQIYEQTLAQTEENAQEVETGRLQRIAAAVEQNLQEVQNTAAPQELARMRGELDGLKNEIVRRQGVTDDVTGVDWIGNREKTGGQIARATGETGGRQMTARADVGIGPYGDGGRIAADAGLAMKGNGTGTQNDVAGVDWIGNREETSGQIARATGDNGGRPMTAPTETGGRIAADAGLAMTTNENSGQIARAAQEGLNNGYSGNTEGPADGVQRDAGLGAEGQAGGLGEGTGGSVGRSQKSSELAQLRNYVQARADQRRGSAALGVLDGTDKANNILIEGDGLTRTLREIQADAARDGVRVSFMTGTIETVTDGVRRTGGGVFQIDRDGTPHLFIQADSRSYSPRQIYDHERFHAIIAANRGIWSDIVAHLYKTHSPEEIRQMVDAYVQAYDGCYGYEEADAEKYLEEIFADVYAEMQRGGGQQRAARELAGETAQRFAGDIEKARQNRAGIDNRNGPGTRLSAETEAITTESTEEERYNILSKEHLIPAAVNDENLKGIDLESFNTRKISSVQKGLQSIAQALGLFDIDLRNSYLDFPFGISRNSFKKSLTHQLEFGGNYMDYVKMLSCFEDLVENAHLIETHTEKKIGTAKENEDLKQAYVLLSAYRDGNDVVPVELLVKEFWGNDAGLYMVVTLTKIDSEVVAMPAAGETGDPAKLFSESIYSLSDILRNVNPEDDRFLKYVPDGFLSEEQLAAKKRALKRQEHDYKAFGEAPKREHKQNLLENRVSGDKLLDAQDLIETLREVGAEVDERGYVTVYHRTTAENAARIQATGKMFAKEDGLFFSVNPEGRDNQGYGDSVVKLVIPAEKLVLDDIFTDDASVRIPLENNRRMDVSRFIVQQDNGTRLSTAEEDDALSVDWIGNREERETAAKTGIPSSVTAKAATPSPQGEGSGGQSARAAEDFEAMAREKKVALAEKTGIDGLKSRIKNAEERLRMWQAMEKSGLAAQDAKSVQELKNRIADAQETVNIFREELARKQDAKKAARTDPAMKQERAVRRRDEKAALRKETELADNKPRQARKEFRQDALNLFGIQAGKRQALGNILNSFADRLLAQGSVSEADRADLFRQLYEAGVEVVPAGALERMVRETVKDGRIYVPESVRQEFGDDWTAFRERAWGNGIYLTNNQSDRGADSWNAELAEVFPGSFDAEETDARNMLENIVDLAEEGKAEFVSIGEMMKRNQAETGVTVDQQMDELERKVDKLIDTFAQKAQLEIDVRKQGTMKLVKERQRNRETAAREVQRRKENATRSQVMKQLQQLNKMRKKSEPVIQKQIDAIIGNLDIMARSISPEGMENLQALARKYMEAAEDPNFLGNPYVEARLARLNKVQLDNLEISDVIELGRTISALVKSVTEDKRLLTDTRNREIADAAADVRREVESSAGSHSGKLGQFYSTEHLSPTRELQKLGGWVRGGQMESLSRALEDGGTKRLEYMRQANRIFDGFLSEKNNQKWLRSAQGKHAEWIQINVPTGYVKNEAGKTEMGWKPLEITPMMRVALLMHSRNVDNLRHIETGGIVIPDKAEYIKGNKQEALARGTRVKMRPETVRAIVKDCTAQELAFAKLLEQYYDGFSKNKINEVSMLIDGFERAGGEHYYGIKVSQDFLAKQPESVKMDMSLESIGSIVNERIHAGNPIILEDATDALTSHIDLISKYYGFAAPIRDFNAVMNYTFHEKGKTAAGEEYVANAFETSVRETLRQKWGDGAQKYIDKLLSDLQQSKGSSDLMGSFLAKLRGNLAGASLTFNAAVALSQTASLPGAMQTLGLGGVTAALKPEKVDMQLVEKYTPILWYRNQGNSTQELGDYMKEQGITGKMPWFFNWIQKMDSWTIRRIWVGAEYRVSKDTDLAPGSKEEIEAGTDPYYQEVARVFNRAVYDTQPNYSEMQRPGILRSESDLTKSLTMYKTVPLQYYNMMYEAVGRLRADSERAKASPNDRKAQADLKESKSFAAKTFVGILGANVTYVVMKALVKALTGRGKKYQDDDGKYTPKSVLGRLGLDLTETYAGSIIGGSDLLNAGEKLYGAITTGKYSSYGGTEISMISAIEDTLGELYNLAAKLHKEDYTGGIGAVKELAKQLAVDFGFPANNMETYLLAMTKWISPEWADRYENFFDEFQRADLKGEHGRNLTAAVRVLMDNRTDGLSDDTVDELVRLWESGKIMQIPNAVPWSVSVGGNDITLGSEGRSKFREEWSRYVSSGLDSLIKDKAYRKASDADKAAMIKKLYDFATAAAKKSTVIGYEPDKWVNVGIAAVKAGVLTAQYVVFAQQLKTINGKDDDGETITGLKDQRSVELLRDTGWTDAQQELVYLQSSMTSDSAAARVQGLRDAGLTWDQTCDVVSTIGGDWAKATAIIDSDASNSAKLKALEYYLSGSTLRTAQVGVDYHVDLKLWADARTQADADGNGSINQAEATAYLDELNVSWEDKAYIWQMVCYSSKWAKNPYSTTLGEDIWHSLHPDD